MTVCVSPPVAGTPVPYLPVKVTVRVPGKPLTVLTVMRALAVPPALTVTLTGALIDHPAGKLAMAPEIFTVPAKPLRDVMVTVYLWFCPPLMVVALGVTEIEKSRTF